MPKFIVSFILNFIFLGCLIAQPKPTYESSTAYIIWYDAQQRTQNTNSGQASGYSGGGTGSGTVGSGSYRLNRLMKRLNRDLSESSKRQAAKENLKSLNSQAEYEFWNAAYYFDHGEFDSATMAYERYSGLIGKQAEYSQKNNVALDMYENKSIIKFEEHQYYDFMINYRLENYERAFGNCSFIMPVQDRGRDFVDFPAGTVKSFRNIKEVRPDAIVPCLYLVTCLGQMNICKDGKDILNKLSPHVKDTIQEDYVTMLDYAVALASVRDYSNAFKIFDEVIREANNPNLTFAIAKDLYRMLSKNPSHEKQLGDYTTGLFDTIINFSGNAELAQQSKQKIVELNKLLESNRSVDRYKEFRGQGYATEGLNYYKIGDYKNGVKCMNKYFKKKRSQSGGSFIVDELDGSWPVYCQIKMLLLTNQYEQACGLWREVYEKSAWMIMNSSLTTINSFLNVEDMTAIMNCSAQ